MNKQPIFAKIPPRRRVSEEVVARIEEMILSAELKPGDPLPAGHQLASSLGVSRPVVQQAMRVLADRGLVRVEPGSGIFVTAAPDASLSDTIRRIVLTRKEALRELCQSRRILEAEIVRLATEKATPEEIETLKKICDEHKAAIGSPKRLVETGIRFHAKLAQIAGNRIVALFLHSMERALHEAYDMVSWAPGAMAELCQEHYAILEAVAGGNGREAQARLVEHSQHCEELLVAFHDAHRAGAWEGPSELAVPAGAGRTD